MIRRPRSRDATAAWLLGGVALICAAAAAWEWRVSPAIRDMSGAIRALARHDARLQDWANIGRYRAANRLAGEPDGRTRVVFLGDSITDFWSRPSFGGFFPGHPYTNRGIWGQTTAQMLVRFRPDVLDLHPAAVVIHAGTNDIAGEAGPATDEEIEGNLESMSQLAAAHGVRVILASLLPVSDYHQSSDDSGLPETVIRPAGRIRAVNAWLKSFAGKTGGIYLDYYSATVDSTGQLRREFSDDGLHPNAQGYAAMAPLAEEAIARALR